MGISGYPNDYTTAICLLTLTSGAFIPGISAVLKSFNKSLIKS